MTFETVENNQDQSTTDTIAPDAPSFDHRGTYSPEDNKLRLYPAYRLDKDLYLRLKEAGFKWAPKQELFVAPMWTPYRADLLIQLCGDIEDEDTSLVDRAEDRADRFQDYQANRTNDAYAAKRAVDAIAQNIPFGQPILIGHHSERRARKEAQRIDNGMRKAVKMWDTAEYWKRRAAGALSHAKYKELPAVRYRRMKTIEADKRKQEKYLQQANNFIKHFSAPDLTLERAKQIAGFDHTSYYFTLEKYPRDFATYEGAKSLYSALSDGIIDQHKAAELAINHYQRVIKHAQRWINHCENRIAYEKAMLDESGGTAADKFDIVIGGKVQIGRDWYVVKRVNRKDGKIVSVTVNMRFVPVRGIEEVKDYQAPTAEEAEKVAAVTKVAPLTNFPADGVIAITKAQWDKCHKDYKGTDTIAETATLGRHRVRKMIWCFADPTMTDSNKRHQYPHVYITDSKRIDPPKKEPKPDADAQGSTEDQQPERENVAQVLSEIDPPVSDLCTPYQQPEKTEFDILRDQIKQGIKVVAAPQLFPTPSELAARMVALADIKPGMRVLEPSAGTGRILNLLPIGCEIVAVEINSSLADQLTATDKTIVCSDFLNCSPESLWGGFDRIVMNPPFGDAQDIKHIKHALTMLNRCGKLVAICAAGSRQKESLLPIVEQFGGTWELLPSNTFTSSGTNVNTVLLTIST